MPSNPQRGGVPRRSFALTGPSVTIDPRTNAVRRDIADIRLAEFVFAPHYASPLAMRIARDVDLRCGKAHGSEVVVRLHSGEPFEVFEYAGGDAWGLAPASKLVGYLPADALAPLTQ